MKTTTLLTVCLLLSGTLYYLNTIIKEDIKKYAIHNAVVVVDDELSPVYGSGIIFTRKVNDKLGSKNSRRVDLCWTAGHVIRYLREEVTIVDTNGNVKHRHYFRDGKTRTGRPFKVIAYSEFYDLGLLMFTDTARGFEVLNFSEDNTYAGQKVYSVSNPEGMLNTYSEGVVSAKHRTDTHMKAHVDQVTVICLGGSSGGPVFNEDNEVVGILVSTKYHNGVGPFPEIATNIGFMTSISNIREFCRLNDLLWAIDRDIQAPSYYSLLTKEFHNDNL